MSKRKKQSLPFDRQGGTLAIPRRLVESPSYLALSPFAKCLLVLLHLHWRNEKPVDYGIREAMHKVPCSKPTAMKAFQELQDRGFITKVDESLFNSRTQSRARTWKLNWLPYMDKPPTREWDINKSTGQNLIPAEGLQVNI